MGNPHAVIFVDNVAELDLEKIGPSFERHICFPKRTNTEFAQVINPSLIEMRVWERGSGETLACGTGACATVVAACLNKLSLPKAKVRLLGGELDIEWDEKKNKVYMTGPATTVFFGEMKG
jgi:diaminopimelate epimerase